MSAEATAWVWRNSPYNGAQLLVHLAIGDVVNDLHGNEFWMSTDALAKKAKVSRSTAVATLSDMTERGFLEVLEAGGQSRKPTRYRFVAATSAVSDTTSAIWPRPLARSPRANSSNTKEQTKEASAVSALEPCELCNGAGWAPHPSEPKTSARCVCNPERPLLEIAR